MKCYAVPFAIGDNLTLLTQVMSIDKRRNFGALSKWFDPTPERPSRVQCQGAELVADAGLPFAELLLGEAAGAFQL